jgi:hypothetical protein
MKIKNREKFLTIVTIGIIALFAGDRLILSPLVRIWKERTTRIADLTKALNKGSFLLDREGVIQDRWENMKTNALPSDESVARDNIMKAAYRWAEVSQFPLASIKPQTKQGDDYVTIDCRADGNGSIDVVMKFLYELEKDPLPLKVEDLEITARDSEGQQLSLGVRFSGLLLKSEEQ